MKRFLSIITILFVYTLQAQTVEKIDSLQKILTQASEDTSTVSLLINISKEYRVISLEKSLEYAERAEALAEKLSDEQKKIKTKINLGITYKKMKDYERCYEFFNIGLNKAQQNNDDFETGNCIYNIGSAYSEQGKYEKAMEKYFESLKYREQCKDTNGIAECYNYIGVSYFYLNDFAKAMEYYEKSIEMKLKIKEYEGLSMTHYNKGIVFFNRGDFSDAIKSYTVALSYKDSINDKNGKANCFTNIGNVYYRMGNIEKALQSYFKSLSIKEELSDSASMARLYNNIGNIYEKMRHFEKSFEMLNKSLALADALKSKNLAMYPMNNLGTLYRQKKDFEKSLECYFKALNLAEETNSKSTQANAAGNIGQIYVQMQKFNLAEKYYNKCLALVEEIGDKHGIADMYYDFGLFYTKSNNWSKAKNYLLKGMNLAKEIGAKTVEKNSYEGLSDLFALQNDFKNAYEYHKLFSEKKDSLFNEESSKQITEMQTKYETEKKELQIENLNKDNEIKSTEIKKQNFQKLAFAGGFGLMLILAFVIFRGYNQKRIANEIISAQKTEMEKQKQMVEEKNQSLEIAYKHIEEKNTEILDSIRYAKRIQEAILPPQKLVKTYLEQSFILYKPKDIVAGDFYWMHCNTDLKSVLFASVDCTGHGVPGAFVSILGYNELNRCVKEFGLTKPSEILDKLCELVDEAFAKSENDIKDGMDIALVNLTINPSPMKRDLSNAHTNPERGHPAELRDGVIQYAGAGNSLYHIRNGILTEYSPDKQPIGKFAYRKPFTNHEIQLQKGDSIYIFTDGYADQFGGPKGKKFKYSQFEKLLISIQDKPMTEQREILNNTIDEWRGEMEQIDDICMMGVRI